MMDRDPTIVLDLSEVRCTAITGCSKAPECARRMAAVPVGGTMEDYSAFANASLNPCKKFIAIRRGYVAPDVRREVKVWPGV